MKKDREAIEECLPEISKTARKEIRELQQKMIIQVRNLGEQGANELLGALMRVGELPLTSPAAQRIKKKREREWVVTQRWIETNRKKKDTSQ